MTMHWSLPWVGLPWRDVGRDAAGVDCWGVVYLAFNAMGAPVPRYDRDYACVSELGEISSLLSDETAVTPWREIEVGQERDRDMLVFRRGGIECHVGIVAGRGLMLHIPKDGSSRLERYDTGIWKPRLSRIYRHEAFDV